MSFNVEIKNLEKTIISTQTDSLLKTLKDNGFNIKSTCGGTGSCADCVVKIVSGEKNINEMTFSEKKLLGNVFHITKERLSCQCNLFGDITIDISEQMKNASYEQPTNSGQKSKTILKKSAEVKPEVKVPEKDPNWFKHWEKTEEAEDKNQKKSLGGGKRPKAFNYKDIDSKDE